MSGRFTDGRVPDPGIAPLLDEDARWRSYLQVEAALAASQADLGLVPAEAAAAIAGAVEREEVDLDRVRDGVARTSHPLMPLVTELARAVGDPHGGWVHWGATTQNITQTGETLLVQRAHDRVLALLADLLDAVADLAERGAEVVMVGRTHGQHAVPVTFGLRAATWAAELGRAAERLTELEPRRLVAMLGGAAGTFASFGPRGPELQDALAQRLHLRPMEVPSRSSADHLAEHVSALGLLAATGGRIAKDVYALMATDIGEVEEPLPAGTVGSSTMPHKRNPQLSQDVVGLSAEVRALVPLALEGVLSAHEGDDAPVLVARAEARALALVGDMLVRLVEIARGLRLDEARMRENLRRSRGLIGSEAVMLLLGEHLGRQRAHDAVYEAAQAVATHGGTFADQLMHDPRVAEHLTQESIRDAVRPRGAVGSAPALAQKSAVTAREIARTLRS